MALEAKGQVSPEISQLQAVETHDAWLGQLQKVFFEYQLAADPVEPQPEAELPDSLIVRMVTMEEEPVLDVARVQAWYKQLQRLITDFRQEMVEF